jgi:hypothetical protein
MKRKITNLLTLSLLMVVSFGLGSSTSAFAQNAQVNQNSARQVNTNTRILYHDGSVMIGASNLYIVWYGCWDNNCGSNGDTASQSILNDFMVSLGSSPYFQMNAMYPNGAGQTPSGALLYGGSSLDPSYSHGRDLTVADIQGIITDKILDGALPPDPPGIYLVLSSADVGSTATGFCVPSAQPHHGTGFANGSQYKYAFVGNPVRCPAVAAPQFLDSNGNQLPTPNGSMAADAMVSTIAHVVAATVTNPTGGGWFDRYGLQNADKCVGEFGTTYLTANGARANMKLGQRDYLIQQNWVNDRKGHCAMNSSL